MHNSKKITSAVIFIVLLILINGLCNVILVPPYYTQNMFRDLKKQKDIDLLILGDSLPRCSYNTPLICRELGINAYNLNQTAADLETDVLMLKYAVNHHKINTVILSWDIRDTPNNDPETLRNYYPQILHNMTFSAVKLESLYTLIKLRYTTTLFYWSELYDIKNIPEIIRLKKGKKYRAGQVVIMHPDKSPRLYLGQGCYAYRATKKRSPHFRFSRKESAVTHYTFRISKRDIHFLRKIKKICDSHNIRIIAVSTPVPDSVIENFPGWQDAVKKTKKMFAHIGIQYIDTSRHPDFPGADEDYRFRDTAGHILYPYLDDYSLQFCNLLKKYHFF